jgi:hypothetical protein
MYWLLRSKDNGLYFTRSVVDFSEQYQRVADLVVASSGASLVHLTEVAEGNPVVVLFQKENKEGIYIGYEQRETNHRTTQAETELGELRRPLLSRFD